MTALTRTPSLADRFFMEAMSPAFRSNPYPYYERFRGPAPLLRVADTIWFAFGHADVTALLRHPGCRPTKRRTPRPKRAAPIATPTGPAACCSWTR